MTVLDALGIRVTAAVNAAVCERCPAVIDAGKARGWEVVAHGLHMGQLHHAGLAREDEATMVREAVATVRRVTGQPVRGWLSPANSESLDRVYAPPTRPSKHLLKSDGRVQPVWAIASKAWR